MQPLKTTAANIMTAAVVLLCLLTVPTPARAHEAGSPDVLVLIDELPPQLDGIQVQLAERVTTQLVIANPTRARLEVLSLDGRAFLRLGPDGTEANLAVADWYTTNDPFGGTPLPEGLDGADRWRLVATEPTWGFYDHRLHPGPIRPPPELVALAQPADFGSWSVPLQVDGQPVELTGRYRFQPHRGNYQASITQDPDLPGVTVAVLPGAMPGLFIDNTGTQGVVVLGRDGEPFLRISPDGVEANLRSPSWLASARAGEGSSPTDVIDATAEPDWSQVSTAPRFGWIEPRTTPGTPEPPGVDLAQPSVVLDWTVDLLVDDQTHTIIGQTTWIPVQGAAPARSGSSEDVLGWAAVLAAGLIGIGGLLLTRRRRRP